LRDAKDTVVQCVKEILETLGILETLEILEKRAGEIVPDTIDRTLTPPALPAPPAPLAP